MDEENILREHYPKMGSGVAVMLPFETGPENVRSQAKRLGIKCDLRALYSIIRAPKPRAPVVPQRRPEPKLRDSDYIDGKTMVVPGHGFALLQGDDPLGVEARMSAIRARKAGTPPPEPRYETREGELPHVYRCAF